MLVDVWIGQLIGVGGLPIPTAGSAAKALEPPASPAKRWRLLLGSHLHPDHVGSLFDGHDRPVFPRALPRQARGARLLERTGARPRRHGPAALCPGGVRGGGKRFLAVATARLELFDAGRPVTDGVRSMALPGHTPGQGFIFDGGGGEAPCSTPSPATAPSPSRGPTCASPWTRTRPPPLPPASG